MALTLISIETGEKRQLTFPPKTMVGDCYGVFSPDGRTVAFVRASSSFSGDLIVLSLTPDFKVRGEPRRLISNRLRGIGWISGQPSRDRIAWTADGREIVFSSNRGGTLGLWRIAVSDSGEPKRLIVGEDGLSPSVSHNRLVYSRVINDGNIWRLNLSDPREPAAPFIASTRDERIARYSPDGAKIAFASERSGVREIWVCDAHGEKPVQLTFMGRATNPYWSHNSQELAFGGEMEGYTQVFRVSAQGGQPRRIRSLANDMHASWSHDGKWIYFSSNRGGSRQIWKAPADGGDPVQVTSKGPGFMPLESADGKVVYYTTNIANASLREVPVNECLSAGSPRQWW
jgi:Tol biopolymer transport system component